MGMPGMTDQKPSDKSILAARKERRLELAAEMKALGKYKKRLKYRLQDGREWPITNTGDKADIDHEDVMAPLPEDMRAPIGDVDEKMQALRKEADKHQAFDGETVPVDPGVLQRRRREMDEDRAARDAVVGEKWTEELVEARLVEAYQTLFRSSVGGVFPREFGNAMPKPIRAYADLVNQAGNKSLRNELAHRFKGVPSSHEVQRAGDALAWVMTYLKHDKEFSVFVSFGAYWKARGDNIGKKCTDMGIHRQVFYRDKKEAIKLIVEGLTRDGRAPT